MAIQVSAAFDSGNGIVEAAEDPNDIRIAIAPDHRSDFLQWFHFRLAGVRGVPLTVRLTNAGACAYPKGWPGYRAVYTEDRQTHRRAETAYDDGVLTIRHTPQADSVAFSYFAPYPMERHHALVAATAAKPGVRLQTLGRTLDGQDLDLLTVGAPVPARRSCWVIARQHPGESMAEWWMEGFLARLTDPADALARALLERCTFHVVPNMNPDGSRRGHLRTNAAGTNLNRAWAEPTMEASPEVALVLARMRETGVDFCLDVHGDEEIPYNFIAGAHGIPSWSDRLERLHDGFCAAHVRANPDFQTEHGYGKAPPGRANLTMATNAVAETFGCLAMTLEMPFKDNAAAPDPDFGWSPDRSMKLARSSLDALAAVVDELR
ncbi:MAG: M14-type cytosolic carboxypeptidase [Alphaproteobacteria bacterium]